MDQERLKYLELKYLEQWAREVEVKDERDLAHRQTVLELIEHIWMLEQRIKERPHSHVVCKTI